MRNESVLRLKKADILLFALPVIIGLAAVAVLWFNTADNRVAVIEINNSVAAEVPLDGSFSGSVNVTAEYNNKIVVKDGKIGILSADCKDNVCVHTGFIGDVGQTIVCVPSKLVISVREQ